MANSEGYARRWPPATGKTVVMAMLIAWQIIKQSHIQKTILVFAKHVFVVAPGLTVKNRLEVINPAAESNYYREFDIVPFKLSCKN